MLTLNYSLYPYATVRWNDLWKWDDFCFERDIAWYRQAELKNRALAAGEVLTLQLPPSDVRYPITVRTESGSSVEVVFEIAKIRQLCHEQQPGHSLRDQNMDTGLKHFSAHQ